MNTRLPRAAFLPCLDDASDTAMRLVPVQDGAWLIGYDPQRIDRASAEFVLHHLIGDYIAVSEHGELWATRDGGATQ